MKNFGKGSWSSVIGVFLSISWYVILVGSICAGFFYTAVISSPAVEKFITEQMMQDHEKKISEISKSDDDWKSVKNSMIANNNKDLADWETFKKVPLAVKMLAYPYLAAVVVLLLLIIGKSRLVFNNFRNEKVFIRDNVVLISGANKLLIAFSIITFNFSGLFTCVLLFMLTEIFKNGAELQELKDLTV